jgi:anti-sigma factor RsiW
MSPTRGAVGEDELHARLDGQLPTERIAAVDFHLAEHPEDHQRWSEYAAQRQALRKAFAISPAEPIPARLQVARLLAARRRRRERWAALAAGIALFVVGAAAGWSAHNWTAQLFATRPSGTAAVARMVTADAISAYRTFSVEVRHPVEVDVGHEAHLVQWLSKRLGRPLVVPDLTAAGFQLMGGRLLPAEDGPAAQFMYQNGKGDRLTLYLRSGIGGDTAFRYQKDAGIGAFYWSDQGFGYAIAAKADRDTLLRIAELVYRQISPEGGKAGKPPPTGKPS